MGSGGSSANVHDVYAIHEPDAPLAAFSLDSLTPAKDPDREETSGFSVRPPDRSLPLLHPDETRVERWTWMGLCFAFAALYAFAVFSFWAPADGGIDQNAYLVGGRMLARHGSTRVAPESPFAFVGPMFVVPEKGEGYYPKYPIGLPLLYAASLKLFGEARGTTLAFAVSPACAIAAVIGMFFLARAVAGSFAALLAAIALATCEVMWRLANVANSHASCVAFVVWGMFLLVRWWQSGSIWRGAIGGLLLGYAFMIRYTEGLLLLPIALACAFRVRWRDWRSYLRNATPVIGWLVPVLVQTIFNKATIGAWTGYDSSNESEFGRAFTWAKFKETWELMIRTFHDQGLFFLLPLGVAGLVMLFDRSWRLAIVMFGWLLPGVALYTSYYWSPDRGVSYARFFLTFFPALLVGVAVCIRFGIMSGTNEASIAQRIAKPLAAGIVIAIAAGVATYRTLDSEGDGPGGMGESLPAQLRNRLSLATVGDVIRRSAKDAGKDAILFTEDGRMGSSAAHYLAFAGDWELFTMSSFDSRGVRGGMRGGGPARFGGGGANDPSPMQPKRREVAQKIYANLSDDDLIARQNQTMDAALATGRQVFVIATPSAIDSFEDRYLSSDRYHVKTLQRWKEPPEAREPVDPNAPPRRRGFGGGGPGMRGGRGGGPGGFGGPESRAPLEWELVEITSVASATSAPATVPTASP